MEHGRLFIDSTGVEWEVYDESHSDIRMALDWEYPPQTNDPGLIFDSRLGRRRVYPCPPCWERFDDAELETLCQRARSLV